MKAKAPYDVKKWQEETIQQIAPNMKMTKASVEFALRGEIERTAANSVAESQRVDRAYIGASGYDCSPERPGTAARTCGLFFANQVRDCLKYALTFVERCLAHCTLSSPRSEANLASA
jgi:hypothetical protein